MGLFRTRVWEAARLMGPSFLVAVAYLDPGNWATCVEAGSRFGYELVRTKTFVLHRVHRLLVWAASSCVCDAMRCAARRCAGPVPMHVVAPMPPPPGCPTLRCNMAAWANA